MADHERRFTDEQVAEILRRAVQPVPGSHLPARRSSEGISLAQLESVAAEAGIDPARVRQAALELGEDAPSEAASLVLGPRVKHVFDRVVEGEVPTERMSDLVSAIRRRIRVQGNVTEVGDWLEWTSDAKTIHISVKPEDGQTRLQVMGDAGFKVLTILGPTGLATLISLVSLGEAGALTVGLAAGIVGGAVAVARGAWEWVGRRAVRKYRRLADELVGEVDRLAAPRDAARKTVRKAPMEDEPGR